MNWWQKALIGTGTLVVLTTLGVTLKLSYIEWNAESDIHAEAWSDKLAETSGLLFGFGLVAIRGISWKTRRPKQ